MNHKRSMVKHSSVVMVFSFVKPTFVFFFSLQFILFSFRPMDLQTIKRNIESGVIRNTAEFQRDMMLMFLNATMYNTSDHNVHQMAHQMMQDTIATIEVRFFPQKFTFILLYAV